MQNKTRLLQRQQRHGLYVSDFVAHFLILWGSESARPCENSMENSMQIAQNCVLYLHGSDFFDSSNM